MAASLEPLSWQTFIVGLRSQAIQARWVPPQIPPPSFSSPPAYKGNQLFSAPALLLLPHPLKPKDSAWPHKVTGCQATPGILFKGTSPLRSPRPGQAGSQVAATACSSKAALLSKLQPRKPKQGSERAMWTPAINTHTYSFSFSFLIEISPIYIIILVLAI